MAEEAKVNEALRIILQGGDTAVSPISMQHSWRGDTIIDKIPCAFAASGRAESHTRTHCFGTRSFVRLANIVPKACDRQIDKIVRIAISLLSPSRPL